MSSNIFQSICQVHNSEIIAIKLSPSKQVDDNLMCIYCLTGMGQQFVVPINEIQKLYDTKLTIIKQFHSEKNQLINSSLNIIIDTLNQLKKEMNISINKGIQLIQNQLQQQSLNQQVNLEDSEKSLSDQIQFIISTDFSYGQQQQKEDEFTWIQSLSQELKKFNKIQEIQYCLQISEDLKKQNLIKDQNINPPNLIQKLLQSISYSKQNERTPKLELNCKLHGKEIIMFDINQATDKEKRLCCIECMPLQYISLSKAQEKWKQFEVRKSNYFQQQIIDKEQYYESLKEQIIKIEFQIIKQIKNLRFSFEQNLFKMKQKLAFILNQMHMNFQNFTLLELQEKAQILSKSEESQQRLIFSEYQEIQDSILQQLKEQLQQLQFNEQSLYDNLRSMLCNSQEMSKATSQSDQQLNLNNIHNFIIENRDISNNNQIEQFTQRSQESQECNSNTLQALQIVNENRLTRSVSAQVKSKFIQNDYQQIEENKTVIQQEEQGYKIIQNFPQNQNCNAISFNHDNQIMVSGCQNEITIWDFNNGKIIKKQQLVGHTNLVISLCFSLNKNEFISGSTDKSIRYWQFLENEWICSQVLLGHKRQIDCLLFDNKGDQIISCSSDKSIRIWRKNQQLNWIQVQVLVNHQAYVRCISFSKSQEKFVSCGEDKIIIVWEIDEFKEWKLKQIIRNSDYGYRICFVDDQFLIWQPRNINQAIIYEWNSNLNQFDQSLQNIQLLQSSNGYQNFFPSIYNEEKQIIINKHGRYVYVLKKLINNTIIISQVIEVGHYCNYGSLSQNGEYLVIWDEDSRNFVIRKFTL
ncbi:unnamed protein product [Paramecium sonneborni]|uniref:WD domain, G-beta repeat protein n=1 Tax=Paramecium sonneborni TaxID=65129 RepID=A0A8S1QVR0_9CILI|nr:unnamed protein product [Paramecium sonneborni]